MHLRARAKGTLLIVALAVGAIVGFWSLLFITDYIMYKNDKPIIFGFTDIVEVEGKHVITEKGLGYYVVMTEDGKSELYVFGHKAK